MTAYLYIRFDFPSGNGLGPSKVAILEGIDRFGSIAASARMVGLTYRQVWATVKVLNESFSEPLVDIRVGGRASGASLTALGKAVVTKFRVAERLANAALEGFLGEMEAMLGEDVAAPAPRPKWAGPSDATDGT